MAYLLPGVPIIQPAHLEGNSEFATEILPGPPPLVSVQQGPPKQRDPRKPVIAYSYLPESDPGSTYSGIMHGTLVGQEAAAKRSKVDTAAASRAQRATARQQNVPTPPTKPSTNNEAMIIDDEVVLSSSSSSQNGVDPPSASVGRSSRRKEKGKGREVEVSAVRVKEEPVAMPLPSPEPLHPQQGTNDDHCSACRSLGALIYCDGCPRAFHLWCLNPPLENKDIGESKWFCPACKIRKHPPRKPPASFFSPLLHTLDTSIPSEFQLPEDLRNFFKDVASGERGAYVDTSVLKPPRLNRHGQLEDRDIHRLRDRNGNPVLCFRCGTSSLPEDLSASASTSKRVRRSTAKAAQYEVWKNIISCDFCELHWHLDCLDPPLSTMPSFSKKWMCPNHAEQVMPSKKRIPKQHGAPIDITRPKQVNNGNIEVISSHPSASKAKAKVPVDEVMINGRRYRVPERIILLDFWNKISSHPASKPPDADVEASGLSSPLTELSSLEDDPDCHPCRADSSEPGDYEVALMLCKLQTSGKPQPQLGQPRRLTDATTQTDQQVFLQLPAPSAPTRPRVIVNRQVRANNHAATVSAPPTRPAPARAKRKKATTTAPTPDSDRELRSKTKSSDSVPTRSSMRHSEDGFGRSSISSLSSISSTVTSQRPPTDVKEEEEVAHVPTNGLSISAPSGPKVTILPLVSNSTSQPGRARTRKRPVAVRDENGTDDGEYGHRPKKRKDDRPKRPVTPPPSGPSTAAAVAAPVPPTTPSLKIRLPANRPPISTQGGPARA